MNRIASPLRPRAPRGRILAGLALSACAAAAQTQDSAVLEAQVRRLIGNAACTADEQCRTLAFGAKACGGPASYLAWSTAVSEPAALQAAAEKYAARRRDELRASGAISDCALVVDPGATCAPVAAAGAAGQRACRLAGSTGRRETR